MKYMKKQLATELSEEQINQAWEFADIIDDENPNEVRKDFLGARVHRDEYGKNSDFGWYIEYVLDQDFLNKYSTTGADIFCEANVRVLFAKNYLANLEKPIGKYDVMYRYENKHNEHQCPHQISTITLGCVEKLKEIYGLYEEDINSIIKI